MVAAQCWQMTGIRFASVVPALAVLAATGCSAGSTPPPAYPQQMAWTGPPGGAIDQGYGYEVSAEGDGSYEGSYPPGADDPNVELEPSADPADPGYALGDVTEAEIDVTLEASGEWIEDPDYGRVWVPYATVVGDQFTPYDSSGEWVYSDYGWSFASDYDWGWLAFHFGRWAMFSDDRWGWVPDRTWGSSWCEWRHGNGTVGWRPIAPNVRDHRGGRAGAGRWTSTSTGPANARGHRDPDTSWRFAAQTEFGLRRRPTAFALGDGMRATTPVTRPPAGQLSGRASALMGGRLRGRAWTQAHPTPVRVRPNVDARPGFTGARPGRPWQGPGELGQSTGGGRPWMKPPSPWEGTRGTVQGTRTWQTPPRPDGTRWNGGRQQPSVRGGTYQPPTNNANQPQRPIWTAPRDRAPTRPSWSQDAPSRPSYNPPARPSSSSPADRAPPRGSWSQGSPSRPASNPPSRPASSWGGGSSGSFRAPSRPSSASGSYSPPRSSGSSGSFSPSRSSSSSSPSRSSAPSSPSRSSGSSSSTSSSSSGSSRSSSSGGRRR